MVLANLRKKDLLTYDERHALFRLERSSLLQSRVAEREGRLVQLCGTDATVSTLRHVANDED